MDNRRVTGARGARGAGQRQRVGLELDLAAAIQREILAAAGPSIAFGDLAARAGLRLDVTTLVASQEDVLMGRGHGDEDVSALARLPKRARLIVVDTSAKGDDVRIVRQAMSR